MKRKSLNILVAGIMCAAMTAGCGSTQAAGSIQAASSQAQTSSTAAGSTAASAETAAASTASASTAGTDSKADAGTITIWHDNDESIMNAIGDQANKDLAADGIKVQFVKKKDVSSQIKMYGNDPDNGPDMYMFAHDSLGTFVQMGILSPVSDIIDTSKESDLIPMTIKAATYDDKQYLMPVYYESLLFIYNKDLWKDEIPTTTDGLLEYMKKNTDTDKGTYAVVNQYSTSYNVAPVINGFGGYLMNDEGQPGLNVKGTKDAVAYNAKFAPYEADGDYNTITTLFNDKKAQAIIGGPWLISGIKDAGIDYGVKSLTDFTLPNGKTLIPYSGVQCLGVMKYAAESKKDAIAKVLEEISKPEIGTMLANKFNCAPANSKSYDDADVKSNEMICAIEKTAKTAIPMPNIPQMNVVWTPAESMLVDVNKSGKNVEDVADKYQQEALDAIEDMK